MGAGETGIEEWTGQLGREEILLLYTDGVIDDRASDLETQMAKLADLSIGSDSADDLCSRILAAMGRDRADDVALLALQAVVRKYPTAAGERSAGAGLTEVTQGKSGVVPCTLSGGEPPQREGNDTNGRLSRRPLHANAPGRQSLPPPKASGQDSTATAGRRALRLLALALPVAALVVVLYAASEHLFPGGSDKASTILEGESMGDGNLLLHGWILTGFALDHRHALLRDRCAPRRDSTQPLQLGTCGRRGGHDPGGLSHRRPGTADRCSVGGALTVITLLTFSAHPMESSSSATPSMSAQPFSPWSRSPH